MDIDYTSLAMLIGLILVVILVFYAVFRLMKATAPTSKPKQTFGPTKNAVSTPKPVRKVFVKILSENQEPFEIEDYSIDDSAVTLYGFDKVITTGINNVVITEDREE